MLGLNNSNVSETVLVVDSDASLALLWEARWWRQAEEDVQGGRVGVDDFTSCETCVALDADTADSDSPGGVHLGRSSPEKKNHASYLSKKPNDHSSTNEGAKSESNSDVFLRHKSSSQ